MISKNQKKLQNKEKNLHRVLAHNRKTYINTLTNNILSLGTKGKIEAMNIKGLMKRAEKTQISAKTGRPKRKKRFGASILKNCPAAFKTALSEKTQRYGGYLIEINTRKVKASQYNHLTGKCRKKHLSERWNIISYNGRIIRIQRDIYSGFLILNTNNTGDEILRDRCILNFDKFIENHNELINLLAKQKQEGTIIPSCMGI